LCAWCLIVLFPCVCAGSNPDGTIRRRHVTIVTSLR
jgi:hypothetical protein